MTQSNRESLSYYGWIPILSGDISLDIIKEDVLKDQHFDNYFVLRGKNSFPILCQRETNYDKEKKINSIEIHIPEKGVLKINIEELDNKGIVKFKYNADLLNGDKEIKEEYAQKCYNSIKDFYHMHLHHDKKDLRELQPVLAQTKEEAIFKILAQFKEKIIRSHREVACIIQESVLKRNFYYLFFKIVRDLFIVHEYVFGIQQINVAIGEFMYALNFINFYINEGEKEKTKELFLNSVESLRTLRERIAWRLGFFVAFVALFIAFISLLIGFLKTI